MQKGTATTMMFTIGEPAPPEYLIDRAQEVDEIVSLLSNPRINYNVALIGYRRIGKSSILNKVQQQLEDRNITVVNFDVKKNIGAPGIFFERLNMQIFDAYIKHLKRHKRLAKKAGNIGDKIVQAITGVLSRKKLKGVSVETSVSLDGTVSITPKIDFIESQQQPDYQKTMETIFSTARAFAEESNSRFVIMLDEFQDILRLKRYRGLHNIIDLFRSVLQERGKQVSYVVCGSQVHMIRKILQEGDSSLFMHSKEYLVGELDHKYALDLFESYASARGIKERKQGELREIAKQAYKIVGGHPFYLMQLAESWNEKTGEKIEQTFERELRSPIGSLHAYQEHVLAEDLKDAQGGPILRTILQIIASRRNPSNDEPMPSTLTDIAKPLRKRIQELEPYLGELAKFALVTKDEKNSTYVIRDKVLDQYLKMEAQELGKKIIL